METIKKFILGRVRDSKRLPGGTKDFKNQAFGAMMYYLQTHPDEETLTELSDFWELVRDDFDKIINDYYM